jgi:hypothetical protein
MTAAAGAMAGGSGASWGVARGGQVARFRRGTTGIRGGEGRGRLSGWRWPGSARGLARCGRAWTFRGGRVAILAVRGGVGSGGGACGGCWRREERGVAAERGNAALAGNVLLLVNVLLIVNAALAVTALA